MTRAALTLLLLATAAAPVRAQEDIHARMQAWSRALGVECEHCHVRDRWTDSSKPTFAFSQRMMRMVDGLNAGPMKELGGVTCWTCHRGRSIPARLPRALWEGVRDSRAADFKDRPDRALAMAVYAASLGVDCSHCQEPGDWAAATKAPHAMVRRMAPILVEIPKHFDASRQPVTQCYMCHQGKTTPARSPGGERFRWRAKWALSR
ncbi:MAG: photosynthetic reaction center cytochrome c subunit family protein [Acidobacteriota bacterium]